MSYELKKYCSECGKPVSYSSNNKPKFCSSCGKPMFGTSEEDTQPSHLKAKKIVEGSVVNAEEEDMRYDIQEWGGTSLSKLETEIEQDKPVSFKLGEMFPDLNEPEKEK